MGALLERGAKPYGLGIDELKATAQVTRFGASLITDPPTTNPTPWQNKGVRCKKLPKCKRATLECNWMNPLSGLHLSHV